MKKVMLVIDEIQALVGLEAFLRRLGFDVLSLGKDSLVADAVLGFTPELVIASERGRHVDGPKLAVRLKKIVNPPPRVALCFRGPAPILSESDLKSIDALIEIPFRGEAGIRLLAQLASVQFDPLFAKFQKFAGAKLSGDEQMIIVTGSGMLPSPIGPGPSPLSNQPLGSIEQAEWDPEKTPGQSAIVRTQRSNRYDQFLESKAEDFKDGVTDRVLPRERAHKLMSQLRKDSAADKDELDRIQAEKIKFAEAMFSGGEQKKK